MRSVYRHVDVDVTYPGWVAYYFIAMLAVWIWITFPKKTHLLTPIRSLLAPNGLYIDLQKIPVRKYQWGHGGVRIVESCELWKTCERSWGRMLLLGKKKDKGDKGRDSEVMKKSLECEREENSRKSYRKDQMVDKGTSSRLLEKRLHFKITSVPCG